MKAIPAVSSEVGFAKNVLWRMSVILADVYQNQVLLVELLARQTGRPATEVQDQWKTKGRKLQNDLYEAALRDAGIDRDAGPRPEQNWEPPWWVEPLK